MQQKKDLDKSRPETGAAEKTEKDNSRLGGLTSWQSILFITLSIIGLILAVFAIFSFSFRGRTLLQAEYYWLFIGIFTPAVYIALPARKKSSGAPPWYDLILAAAAFVICVYFFINARDIVITGWTNVPLGIVMWIMMMEAARRVAGLPLFFVILFIGLYPTVADKFPAMLEGMPYSFTRTIEMGVFRAEGMMGITTKIVAEIILGFLVFAGVLIATGAGDFFINLANSIFGRFRGGPAKVSVVASAFFGSLSGSIFSNIAGTGSITIKTMKKTGYPAHYAGAIEACASTGGVLMPPVMGAIAFVMAVTIGVEYRVVLIAAIIPSFLFYMGLLLQVDGYAARMGLVGMSKDEVPRIRDVLAKGWPFLSVLLFLIWGLLYMRWEFYAPWYACVLMIVLSCFNRSTWMTPRRLFTTIREIGYLITQTSAIILPIAFVVSGLTITGVTGSVTSGLITLGGGNLYLVLLFGVGACFIMGMAGLAIVAYIFLAVTMAPAIIKLGGLNDIAVHLFIVYYAMLSVITPPVGTAAFLAAAISGSSPMKTCFTAMRLGVVIYFIPLFFIFQPALVLQGNLNHLIYVLPSVMLGIVLISAGFEGYLLGFGRVKKWAQAPFAIAGLALAIPELTFTIFGFAAAVVLVAIVWLQNRTIKADMAKVEVSDTANV